MTAITWLHLSDWHQKGTAFDRQVVRDALIKDLRERADIDPVLQQVDFVVFSGDLAFTGQPEEYDAARQHLLDPVLEAVGLSPHYLFIVPGNHDLNWNDFELLPHELQKPLDSDALIQKWLTDPERRRPLALVPLRAYREFVAGYSAQPSPDYASILQLDAGDKRIVLLGLNSAWMCARNKGTDGKVDDKWFALVGEPQLHDVLTHITDADLRIAVLHHPFEWLAASDRSRVEGRLGRACHFILRGHEHNPQVHLTSGTLGDCLVIPAGACYDRHVAASAYNLVHLNFETGKGVIYLRQWSARQIAWIGDIDSGKFQFSLSKELSAGKPSEVLGHKDADVRRLNAERRYRELLLETCDIINLANLPEQDRHLAQRQLELRRLYVPLRAWVETSAGEKTIETDQEEKLWDALEERPVATLHGRPAAEKMLPKERQRVPVGERLVQSRRLVVLGDPGAGKTTLTRWIATAYLLRLKQDPNWEALPDVQTLPDADWLPIIVRCRDLDVSCLGGSLYEILKHTLRKDELKENEAADLDKLLQARLQQGQALLILDGLDEITDPAARNAFCQQLEQIVAAFPDAPIIATSRIVGYREMGYRLGGGFEHLTLAGFTAEEKNDFARRWCMLTEAPERNTVATEELIHDIHSAERIERLTENPMLLTTMALVKRKIGKLPNRRADLYLEAVQVLLNWRREVDEPLDWREAIPQLEYLAYAMCDRGVQQLRLDEVLELFARMRKEYPKIHPVRNHSPEEFLKRLEARTGILVQAGHAHHLGMLVSVYEFRHLTFQEYLAARALVDGRFPTRDPKRSLAENVAPLAGRTTEITFAEGGPQEAAVMENWREALRLCATICRDDDVDEVLCAILTPLEGELPPTARARAILATFCLADEPNASEQVARQILQTLVAHVEKGDGEGQSKTGVGRAAMEVASTRWAKALRVALIGEFCRLKPDVWRESSGLAAMVGGATAPRDHVGIGEWLTEQAQRLRDSDEVEAIDAALSVMDRAFRGSDSFRDSHDMGEIPLVPGLVDALLEQLTDSAPAAVAAAWALAWLKEWQPTPTEMQRLISFVENPTSNPYAVRFLTWIFRREQVEKAFKPLLFWLTNPIADVRTAVVQALGTIDSKEAVVPLIRHLEDSDAAVRLAATGGLGQLRNRQAVEPLIRQLEDTDAAVRRAAASALGQLGDRQAVEPLIRQLEDTDAAVRRAAASALGQLGDRQAVNPLIRRLEDTNSVVWLAATKALGQLGDRQAVNPLIRRLDDTDAAVRRAAASALGQLGDRQAVEPLIRRLEDTDAAVRRAAASALGQLGDRQAVNPLIRRLDDTDAAVCLAAAAAVNRLGNQRGSAALVQFLCGPRPELREGAVGELAQKRDQIERRLLSWDLDGMLPWIDPQDPITQLRVTEASHELDMTPDNIRAHYESLAAQFSLKLGW